MKKSVLLIASIGVGAGFLYTLWFVRRNQQVAEFVPTDDGQLGAQGSSVSELGKGRDDRERSAARFDKAFATAKVDGLEIDIDDRGTDQSAASRILKTIRDSAFEASDEKLALALGRPTEEIAGWTSGAGMIDGDVLMKARSLAMQRGLTVE